MSVCSLSLTHCSCVFFSLPWFPGLCQICLSLKYLFSLVSLLISISICFVFESCHHTYNNKKVRHNLFILLPSQYPSLQLSEELARVTDKESSVPPVPLAFGEPVQRLYGDYGCASTGQVRTKDPLFSALYRHHRRRHRQYWSVV